MKTILYGISKTEATVLLNHVNNDIAQLALLLWNNGRASSIERGIYKAKRLKKFTEI